MVKPIPEGFSTVTACINVKGAKEAIELYKKAFGATEDYVMIAPGSDKVMHAQLSIGTSKFMLADNMPEAGCGTPTSGAGFYLYVEDCDTAFKKAKDAGLSEKMPVADMFWGDRLGTLTDKWGNMWTIATHVKDVSEDDLQKGAEDMMKQMKPKAA